MSGRLIGGCIETISKLTGTPFGDVPGFGREYADDGLILYLAPDSDEFTQREAVLDALGDLDLPIVFDVEFGHVPPQMSLVNGALAHLTVTDNDRRIVQELR